MKKAELVCIGKIRVAYWRDACGHYLKQLSHWRQITCLELKDGKASLSPQKRSETEGRAILAQLQPGDLPIAMHEKGEQMTSPQLAEFLRHCDEELARRPAFIIGGPFGLSGEVLAACQVKISLSAMTWPHELARVMLLEQLYRAESILRGNPYHHGGIA